MDVVRRPNLDLSNSSPISSIYTKTPQTPTSSTFPYKYRLSSSNFNGYHSKCKVPTPPQALPKANSNESVESNKKLIDSIAKGSRRNSALATLDGIDVMGSRLADEVISVIERNPKVEKISFIGHSLGGLISRYAIAKLYTQNQTYQDRSGKIAGVEAINFITVVTPHLGSRGHIQVPMFCGVRGLEKVGCHSSVVVRRTGRHLYLKDKANGQRQTPLLVQMANDSEHLKFISALHSFKCRVVYANVHSDHLVGWSTSSIRHQIQLPKIKNLVRSGRYPQILKEDAKNVTK
ncbi:putative lipase ROG1 [Lactuca sativa]|uniref:putative lipase ROG1 n=1 Tax=Lactuca sativa TaxID=4236 RepID=UPI0022AFD069|nr:putative lipase ROG1 [Lactuca sativa]